MPRTNRLWPLCILLALLLLAGCGGEGAPSALSSQPAVEAPAPDGGEENEENTTRALRLPWFAADALNPYVSDNQYQRQLSALVYANLVDIGPDMQLGYTVLRSVMQQDASYTLTLQSGWQFADGTPLTAGDVAASLTAAAQSAAYGARFANLLSVTAGEGYVAVQLNEADALFPYLLDIPVLKAAEVAEQSPTASGRYQWQEGKLVKNTAYLPEFTGPASIQLVGVAGYDEMLAELSAGNIDMFASEGADEALSATVALQTGYAMNTLVYLGINAGANGLTASAEGRAALAALIDRPALAGGAYLEKANAADGLFNPLYGLATPGAIKGDIAAAASALGYSQTGAGGYENAAGEPLCLRLLAYGGAAKRYAAATQLADMLREAGLQVELETEGDFEKYSQKIAEGDYELYIGELKLYNNMDFSPLFGGQTYSAAFAQSEALTGAWQQFCLGSTGADRVEQAFAEALPFLPLVWRQGTVYHAKGVTGFTPAQSSMLYNMQGLTITGENTQDE